RDPPERRLPPVRDGAQPVRPPARFDSRSRQAADPPPGRGPNRLRETREVSRAHLRLAGIEAGSVRFLPESKKSASDAPAESRRTARVRRKKSAEPEKGPKAAKAAKAKEAKAEARSLEGGRVHVYSLDGEVVKSVDLPTVFQGEVRSDLIRRAVTAAQANRRQPYGPGRRSGAKHSVRWSGKGHGVSRGPREDARPALSAAAEPARGREGSGEGPPTLREPARRRGREPRGVERRGPRSGRRSGSAHDVQRGRPRGAPELVAMKPHEILLHPYVTEKTLNMLQGTPAQNLKDGNRLEFLVRRQATRDQVKKAFEDLFQVKVAKVNTFVRRDGKHAIIKLKPEFSAEEIGMRIGVF